MDFALNLIVTLASVYFAKEAYEDYRIVPAMFWSCLIGWNLHTLIGIL
jgi:hypothetical protein